MKILVRLALLIVLVVVLAAVAAVSWIDAIAKRGIEAAGTRGLGVATTVDGVSIGLVRARAALDGLAIANPEGFGPEKFLRLSNGAIEVAPRTLLEEVVRIPKIELSGLAISFEEKLGSGSNVKKILEGIARSEGDSGKEGKKFVVEELIVSDIVVTARTAGLPIGDRGIEIKVPKVRLVDIGSAGRDPVGLDQLSRLVVEAVMKAVLDASQGQLPAIFAQGLGEGLAGLDGLLGKATGGLAVDLGKGFEGIGGQLGTQLEGAVQDAAKGAEDAIKKGLDGLFKR
jgi:uncharacterized protein involved in outer membrane biogenesis